jgi:hypothetical protein
MIVYNITTKVQTAIDAAWLQWQQQEHIPEVMATGFFTAHRLFRLLEQDDSDGNTYAVQYFAIDEDHYDAYLAKDQELLKEKTVKKWGDKVMSFRSVLEVIQ